MDDLEYWLSLSIECEYGWAIIEHLVEDLTKLGFDKMDLIERVYTDEEFHIYSHVQEAKFAMKNRKRRIDNDSV